MKAVGWELECTRMNSYKYYRIVVAGSLTDGGAGTVVFQYGRIGTIQEIRAWHYPSLLTAQDVAWKRTKEKRHEYTLTIDETPFDVDPVWLDECDWSASVGSTALRAAFERAAAAGIRLRGSMSATCGPRIVAVRRWADIDKHPPRSAPSAHAALAAGVCHRTLDVRLAVVSPTDLAALDAYVSSSLMLTDLGPAAGGDNREVLATARRLFDPASTGASGRLDECVRMARFVHT